MLKISNYSVGYKYLLNMFSNHLFGLKKKKLELSEIELPQPRLYSP